ncbi:MAG TPA: rhodanese-like domain-containing protein, partial [Lacibacter sp.]|nr:rhodanese-like domain-containing protein [Lacibacter sp.]
VSIVDVRTEEEFEEEHVPGAPNMPLHRIPYLEAELQALSRPIVFYCRSGNRSGQAVVWLRRQGFDNIYNGGGLEDMALLTQTQHSA